MKHVFIIYTFWLLPSTGLIAQKLNLVYTTDQNSNTVTVVDADKRAVVGTIILGYPANDPVIFHPLYNGDINAHGINYDPVRGKLAVVSTVSNSVALIDASTAVVERKAYVGRNPHEPRFTNDGKEIWITVRGENYVTILDANTLREKSRIFLSEGPGMVAFSTDGKTAYVSSSFDHNFWIIDASSRKILKTLKMPSRFSPFLNTTNDGLEVWVTHKDVGMVTRVDTRSNEIIESFKTGPITNHLAVANGLLFVTVGGENKIKVYSTSQAKRLTFLREITTDNLPHGIWYQSALNEMYVVCELSNTLHILNVKTLEIEKTLRIGERPQALIPVSVNGNIKQIAARLSIPTKFKGPGR